MLAGVAHDSLGVLAAPHLRFSTRRSAAFLFKEPIMLRKHSLVLFVAAACALGTSCMSRNTCESSPSLMDRLRSRFGGGRGDCCDGCPSCVGDGCEGGPTCGEGPMLTAPLGEPPIPAPLPGPGPLVPQATVPGQFQPLRPVPSATPVPYNPNGTASSFIR